MNNFDGLVKRSARVSELAEGNLSRLDILETGINDYIAYLTLKEANPLFRAIGLFNDARAQSYLLLPTHIRDNWPEVRTLRDALNPLRNGQVPREIVSKSVSGGFLFPESHLAIWNGYPELRPQLLRFYGQDLIGAGKITEEELAASRVVKGIDPSARRHAYIAARPLWEPAENIIELGEVLGYRDCKGRAVQITLTQVDSRFASGRERGWCAHSMRASIEGCAVGELIVENVPAEAFSLCYPSVWHFLYVQNDFYCFPDGPDDLVGIWKFMNKRRLETEDLPAFEQIKTELETRSAEFIAEMTEYMDGVVNRPRLERLAVEDGPDRDIIAKALLESMGRWQGARRSIFEVTPLIPDNQYIEALLKADQNLPLVIQKSDEDKRTRLFLDYRGT